MLRDETADSVASGHPDFADLGVNGLDISIYGEAMPTPDALVKDSAPEDQSGGPPMFSTNSVFKANGSDTSSSSSMGRKYSLRRAGSNIASLRAAFEHRDTPEPSVKRFEKSPSRSFSERFENISSRSREQDAEIAQLEKRLASEVESRQSLQSKLEAQLRVETETRKTYEDALKAELERETQARQSYQEKCETLEREIGLGQSQRLDEAHNKINGTTDGSSGEVETKDLQRQLYELKRSISTATRIEHQVSDSTLAQEIANLHHELQNFIVNAFRRVKLVKTPEELCERLERIAAPSKLDHLKPVFADFEPSLKLACLQATAICHIMEVFDEPLLFGLPNRGEWRENLRRTVETLPSILCSSTFNKWRYLTLDAVRQSEGIEQSVQAAVTRLCEMTCDTLSSLTDVEDLGARASSLSAIVMRAARLSHLFRVQRAQYEFVLPVSGTLFDSNLMEDDTLEGESSAERTIRCATFPSVIKHGDENGDNAHLLNVVVKAKVLCRE